MKKSTKGAIAAGAAAVLLLGGAGTLAYWSDSGTADGGSVTAGELSMTDPVCDATWVYAAGNAGAGEPVTLIVPGDTIAKECTFDITATGDNLEAELTVPTTTTITPSPAAASFQANVSASFAGATSTITSADDGSTVTATIEVEFPFGTAEDAATPVNINDTQGVTATLDDLTITLVQTES